MNLVIVESPTKARTISRFLGKDYEIKPSMGHVMDLPKTTLGVDVKNNFKPEVEMIADKKRVVSELKKLAKDAELIILATDPDREGEAIASDVRDILSKNEKFPPAGEVGKIKNEKFKRIVFHEITEGAIKEALENPRDVDEHLVDAQTARRVLDRLVGYQLSPVLWKKIRRGLSAGRVQSVALRLIVEREREIEKFKSEDYWTIHGLFKKGTEETKETEGTKGTEFELVEINGEKVEITEKLDLYDGEYNFGRTIITSEEKAKNLISDIKKYAYQVSDVNMREMKRSPYPPFTTSTLQQQAAVRFGLPGKRTMSLAQKLYEEGFITYHRTDSVTISPVAVKQFRDYIEKEYGKKYLPEKSRMYFTKQKNAQEAHEGIRPTHVNRDCNAVKAELGDAYARLYDLIWKRAVASQMTDAVIESTTVYADSKTNVIPNSFRDPQQKSEETLKQVQGDKVSQYRFKANGSVLLFDGFLKLTPQALEDKRLPMFKVSEILDLEEVKSDEHNTTPPPRYNDASLIKTLEEKSIGRPSTYAAIISTLTDRMYVDREERKFIPTSVGITVNDFLVKNFSTIDDVLFTAKMEDDLDLVAGGEKDWQQMMKEFYGPFSKRLKDVEGAERVQIPVEETGEMCPECKDGKVVIRSGRFGKFLSCSRFPDCKFTKPFVEETKYICPKDGGKVIVKKTRRGKKFYGCSNYPACQFAVWRLEDLKKQVTGSK